MILEVGHRSTAQALFGVTKVGYEPTLVAEGVHAAHMELEPALIDYVSQHLRLRSLATGIVRNQVLRRFLFAAPGVNELATLYRITELVAGQGGARWDPLLVDLESTGHATMFFELPHAFEDVARDGPLRGLLASSVALLHEPARTALHLVTLPEDLPVVETVRLYHALKDREHLPLGCLFINRVPGAPFIAEERITLDRLSDQDDKAWRADAMLGQEILARYDRSVVCLEELGREIPLPTMRLAEHLGLCLDVIHALSRSIEEGGK